MDYGRGIGPHDAVTDNQSRIDVSHDFAPMGSIGNQVREFANQFGPMQQALMERGMSRVAPPAPMAAVAPQAPAAPVQGQVVPGTQIDAPPNPSSFGALANVPVPTKSPAGTLADPRAYAQMQQNFDNLRQEQMVEQARARAAQQMASRQQAATARGALTNVPTPTRSPGQQMGRDPWAGMRSGPPASQPGPTGNPFADFMSAMQGMRSSFQNATGQTAGRPGGLAGFLSGAFGNRGMPAAEDQAEGGGRGFGGGLGGLLGAIAASNQAGKPGGSDVTTGTWGGPSGSPGGGRGGFGGGFGGGRGGRGSGFGENNDKGR